MNLSYLFFLSYLAATCQGRLQATHSTDERSLQDVSLSRWMFGAKYAPGTNLTAAIDAFQQILTSCPGYDRAGYGYAIESSSSYYDLALFVDSADKETTVAQAGCMVNHTTMLVQTAAESATDAAASVSKSSTRISIHNPSESARDLL